MGKFYEGIMVRGNTTDATDEAVQANIVAVGYRSISRQQLSAFANGTDVPQVARLGCGQQAVSRGVQLSHDALGATGLGGGVSRFSTHPSSPPRS